MTGAGTRFAFVREPGRTTSEVVANDGSIIVTVEQDRAGRFGVYFSGILGGQQDHDHERSELTSKVFVSRESAEAASLAYLNMVIHPVFPACGKCLRELPKGRECPKCARHPWKLTRKVILAGMIVFIIIGASLWANYLLGLK